MTNPAASRVIIATCLRCGHAGTIPPATLAHYGQSPNVTLAYLSRFVVCQECSSHAVKLERRGPSLRRTAGSRR